MHEVIAKGILSRTNGMDVYIVMQEVFVMEWIMFLKI